MRFKNLALNSAMVALVLAPMGALASNAVRMPKVLRGMWDYGPNPCRLELSPDTQSPIYIDAKSTHGYESRKVPVETTRVHHDQQIWVITTASDAASGLTDSEVYVFSGNFLTITNGERSFDYRRCK